MLSFIIRYWVEILFSLIISIMTYLYKKVHKYIKNINTLEEAACFNLKMHILEKYELIKKKGYITIDEKEEILSLYKLYKSLDCSNIFLDIFNELNMLPVS